LFFTPKPPQDSVSNVGKCERDNDMMLGGMLPSSGAGAEKTARAYKCLPNYGNMRRMESSS
jgi:hypothetical protein